MEVKVEGAEGAGKDEVLDAWPNLKMEEVRSGGRWRGEDQKTLGDEGQGTRREASYQGACLLYCLTEFSVIDQAREKRIVETWLLISSDDEYKDVLRGSIGSLVRACCVCGPRCDLR